MSSAIKTRDSKFFSEWVIPQTGHIITVNYGEKGKPESNKPCRQKGCKEIPNSYSNWNVHTDVQRWGEQNDLPERLRSIIDADKDAPHLQTTNYNFLVGKGVCAFKKVFEDEKKKEQIIEYEPFDEFKDSLGCFVWEEYFEGRAKNLIHISNAFSEYILSKGSQYPRSYGKVASIRNIDSTNIRACGIPKNSNRIEHYRVYSNSHPEGIKVPAFDPRNPTRHRKFIVHTKAYIVGHTYYSRPDYIGALDSLKIRRLFNKYHIAGFERGWSIKNHIEISMKVLTDLTQKINAGKKGDDTVGIEDVEQIMIDGLKEELEGVENNQSNVFTKYVIDDQGHWQGVKITPLKQEIDGNQYLELAKFAQQNNAPSFSVANAIAGIETQGKLGNASELRNHINFHVTYKAYQNRLLLLKDLEVIKKINNWDKNIFFKIEDHPQPVTTDVNKNGLAA